MATETLEFTIYPDGRIVETVKGIKGTECTKLTEQLEDKLGTVTHREDTDERYQTVQEKMIQQQWDSWGKI
ncbi:MAG: DUF2997 domain-containing protein [Synechococcus sp.]